MKVQRPNWFSATDIRLRFEARPWSILSWASGLIALTFIGYYGILAISNPPSAIGQQFVLAEFPPQSISPWFFAKPITWFCYASFLYWSFGLEAQKKHFLRFSDSTRRFLFIVTAVIAFGALYEIFFNFMLWSALEVLCNNAANPPCSPDLVNNRWPDLRSPLNLTFSTKIVTLVFAMSVYSLYYLHRVDKEIDRRSPTPVPGLARQDFEVDRMRKIPITGSYSFDAMTRSDDSQEYTPST